MILDVSGDIALWATHPVNKNDKNLFKIKIEKLLHQELAHLRQVALVHDTHVGEVSFTLFALLGQDVTLVSMFSFNLSGAGKGKPFLRSGIRLNFWHFVLV